MTHFGEISHILSLQSDDCGMTMFDVQHWNCFWRVTSDCTKAEAIFGRFARGRELTFALMFPFPFFLYYVALPEYLFIYLPICVCLRISVPVCHCLFLSSFSSCFSPRSHPTLSLPFSPLHFWLFACVSLRLCVPSVSDRGSLIVSTGV